jgi:magnesium transporter
MHTLRTFDETQIRDLIQRDEFFWLDRTSPSEDELRELSGVLGLDERTVTRLGEKVGRPVLDPHDRYVFMVFFGVRGEERGPIEVRLAISGNFIVTIHDDHCEMFEGLEHRIEHLHEEEGFVVYKVLGSLAGSFYKVLDQIDEDVDRIEDAIMQDADPAHLRSLVDVKNRLVTLRRIATPQRDLLSTAADEIGTLPGLQSRPSDFRDVYQQMISVSELIDSSRDVLTGAQDVYLSSVSNTLNLTTERLTIVATIFLPLTFITGFFGQNFGWLVSHITTFGDFLIFGIGGVVVPLLIMALAFARAGYLGETARARVARQRARQVST